MSNVVSWDPEDMAEGGGLWEGGPAIIRNPTVKKNASKAGKEYTVVAVDLEHLDAEGAVVTEENFWSVGQGMEPSEDGESPSVSGPYCISVQGNPMKKSSNFGTFMDRLKAVLKEAKAELAFTPEVTFLDGLRVNLLRENQPEKRNNANSRFGSEQKNYPDTYLMPTAVLETVPWEEGGGKKVGKPGAKAAGVVKAAGAVKVGGGVKLAATSVVSLDDVCTEIVSGIAVDGGGDPVAVSTFVSKVNQAVLANHKQMAGKRADIIKRCMSADFLGLEIGWSYDAAKKTVSLPS